MLQSLAPLFVALLFTTVLGFIDVNIDIEPTTNAINDIALTGNVDMLEIMARPLPIQLTISAFMTYISAAVQSQIEAQHLEAVADTISSSARFLASNAALLITGELPPEVEAVTSTMIDALSILVLIRMAKIIGTDRDCIIAKNVQTAATEFPVRVRVRVIFWSHML
jgi:hypothetical protein